jgi:hypothetical protein
MTLAGAPDVSHYKPTRRRRTPFPISAPRAGEGSGSAAVNARNLGDRSRLKLSRGPNAPAEAGGLFVTPYRE